MVILVFGVVLFFGIHVFSSLLIKQKVVDNMGEKRFKAGYALMSFLGLIFIVIGNKQLGYQPLWSAFPELRMVTFPVMWLCFILLPAAHMKGNIKRYTRHPMLWGVFCWSLAHLLVNGDLASVITFGSFLLYSLYAMYSQNGRGAQKQTQRLAFKFDLIIFAAGTLVLLLMMFLHGLLFGVPLV